MTWIDWLVVAFPLIAIGMIGYITQKYVNNVSDFLSAGRKAGRYLLAVADGAAGMGLISLIAAFEQQYKSGFAIGFWSRLGVLIGLMMTLTGFITYRFRETRAMTMAQFYEMRYSRGFRIFSGFLAFLSGLVNYALFPAVGARFFIYYCQLPSVFSMFGLTFNTLGVMMAFFLGIALFIVLTGGQLTTMVTDCCQGIFFYLAFTVLVVVLLMTFSITELQDSVLARPDGQSFFNPFNVDKMTDFNLLYVFIGMFGMVYNRNSWLGSQGYMSAAINPHEQKMAGVLGQWRGGFWWIGIMLLVIGSYIYMNSSSYAKQSLDVQSELNKSTIRDFMNRKGCSSMQITRVESAIDAAAARHHMSIAEQQDRIEELKKTGDTAAAEQLSAQLRMLDIGPEKMGALDALTAEGFEEEEGRGLIREAATIRTQMLVPMALRHILPIGVTGIFCALALFLMVSTDTTYMHSWGTILVQDVILPTYHRKIQTKTQIWLLRGGIVFVAVFAWFFSFYFSQTDYILQFMALTGTIYLGGAGACMIGGLYTRRGTTAGAFAAMGVGVICAVAGFCINQYWTSHLYPYFNSNYPLFLEGFRQHLAALGDMLPFANWNVTPENFRAKFPITGQEIYFIGCVLALLSYVVVSFLTCRTPFELDKILHRGQYNQEHHQAEEADQEIVKAEKEHKFNWRQTFLGITDEYSKGDRILAWSVFIWTLYNFGFFVVEAVWNLPGSWRWSERTWVNLWIYYSLPLSLTVAVITTIWFTWGGCRDLLRLFQSLRADRDKEVAAGKSNTDDGQGSN